MRKIVGLVCLLVGLLVLGFAKTRSAADEKAARLYVRQAAEARVRETEIASLRNRLAMDALAVGDAIAKHTDASAAEAEQAKDKARMAELEQAEKTLGTASMNENAVVAVQRHHGRILVEYGAGIVLVLVGLAQLLG